MGDKPLHKAAFTGRKVVLLLFWRRTERETSSVCLSCSARSSLQTSTLEIFRGTRHYTVLPTGGESSVSERCSGRASPSIKNERFHGVPDGVKFRGCPPWSGGRLDRVTEVVGGLNPHQTVFDLACNEEMKQILVGSHDKVQAWD